MAEKTNKNPTPDRDTNRDSNRDAKREPLAKSRHWGTKVLAVILSIFCWFIVALTDTTTLFPKSIEHVPIDVDPMVETFANMGLSIIEMSQDEVVAKVQGNRTSLARLEPSALTAELVTNSEISGPGTYEFILKPSDSSTQSLGNLYQFGSYAPSSISIKLDRLETRSLPVELRMTGETAAPEGYIRKNEVLTPSSIKVTGPQVELDKLARCVLEVDFEQPLDKTLVKEYPIRLLDAQGEEVLPEEKHMSLDETMVQLTVSILKKTEVPLKIEFNKLPRGLKESDIPYTMSNYEVALAGPGDAVDRFNEIVLDYLDISELSRQQSEFTYDINPHLPADFENLENLNSVTVSFDSSQWAEQVFTIPQDSIRILNASNKYTVSLITEALYNVTMVGDKEDIENLTAEDLVVELDLSEKTMTLGQYQQAVRISAPGKGVVWATGDYNVVLQVQDAGEG